MLGNLAAKGSYSVFVCYLTIPEVINISKSLSTEIRRPLQTQNAKCGFPFEDTRI